MPLYYPGGRTLAEAVERLSTSRAKPSLCEFLILKQAMTQGDGTVTLSLGDQTYRNAVDALTRILTWAHEEPPQPYFNPFGTARERTRGWRSKKYPSNGPPVTVPGPGWSQVIEILSQRPRRVHFTTDYLDHLPPMILRGGGPARNVEPPPLLDDCAVWLHRERPVESTGVNEQEVLDRMIETFLEQTGLSDAERVLIFGEE